MDHDGVTCWWTSFLWGVNLPLKLHIFSWLMLNRKIITGYALCKRGFYVPGFCVLCKVDLESVDHLFAGCSFFKGVWTELGSRVNFVFGCDNGCLDVNLRGWYDNH